MTVMLSSALLVTAIMKRPHFEQYRRSVVLQFEILLLSSNDLSSIDFSSVDAILSWVDVISRLCLAEVILRSDECQIGR